MGSFDGGASKDLQVESQVASSMFLRANTFNAEELIQDLLHRIGGGLIRRRVAAAAARTGGVSRPRMPPELIVKATFGRVNEVLVGLQSLPETFRCQGILGVAIGMPTQSQQSESSLDLLLAGTDRNAQNFVIANSHSPTPQKQQPMVAQAFLGCIPGADFDMLRRTLAARRFKLTGIARDDRQVLF
jgi:hypothetical protein